MNYPRCICLYPAVRTLDARLRADNVNTLQYRVPKGLYGAFCDGERAPSPARYSTHACETNLSGLLHPDLLRSLSAFSGKDRALEFPLMNEADLHHFEFIHPCV